MVYDVFANQMRFPTEGATLLTNLCCLNGRLPQGACTSPYLSNLCVIKADNEIAEYCKEHNLSYSRYSDDMTFSGNRNDVKYLSDEENCYGKLDGIRRRLTTGYTVHIEKL